MPGLGNKERAFTEPPLLALARVSADRLAFCPQTHAAYPSPSLPCHTRTLLSVLACHFCSFHRRNRWRHVPCRSRACPGGRICALEQASSTTRTWYALSTGPSTSPILIGGLHWTTRKHRGSNSA